MNEQDDVAKKTEEDWKKELTPEEYEVLRMKGTEAPFSGEYVDTEENGMYACRACGNILFSSSNKFHSGSGWPSFDEAVALDSVETRVDTSHGMRRAEVLCKKCGSHLGHVFDDGPTGTGKRFCINSVCLRLKKGGEK